jgi:uncharacterized protein (TIGR02996 family)
MSETERALLAAIIAAPDDDTPRLVYADWLDEYGDAAGRARAEFIRAQCEQERLPDDDDRIPQLGERINALWAEYLDVWDRELGHWFINRTYARGFIEETLVFDNRFAKAVDEVLRAAPFRVLEIHGGPVEEGEAYALDWAEPLANNPLASRLTTLNLANAGVEEDSVEVLLRSRYFKNLIELNLHNSADFPAHLFHGRGRLPRLQTLNLSTIGIGDDWLSEFLEAPKVFLRQLKSLDLSDNFLTGDGAMALVECPHFRPALLRLYDNEIDPNAADRLRERFRDAVSLDNQRDE